MSGRVRDPSPTQRRPGPVYEPGTPFYCPWCARLFRDVSDYDHAFEHQDVAPSFHLVIEEYYPEGLAAHVFAEGIAP